MIPLTGGVLALAAVVSAPAVVGGVEGTLPLDEAMTRYLIAVAVCWLVLAIVLDLTFPSGGPVKLPVEESQAADNEAESRG